MAIAGNGQSDPNFRREERRWDLTGGQSKGGRAKGICFAEQQLL